MDDDSEKKKAKGTQICVIKKHLGYKHLMELKHIHKEQIHT